jgi:hypothetical protein
VSLEDQADNGKDTIKEMYSGPAEYKVIATKAKGEWVDRPELRELQRLIETKHFDVLFAEDLGRMIRGGEAFELVKHAIRHGVRVIVPHDDIDTADPEWEENALSACSEHTAHNARVSKRVKQKTMNRFTKNIGAAGKLIAGYTAPEGAKAYADWSKVDSATPVYQEAFRLLRATMNYRVVSDYFNDQQFPLGKYCRRKKWAPQLVRQVMRNTILKGFPRRGGRHTVKNSDGHRVSVKNPAGPRYIEVPHLAHVDPKEFDEVIGLAEAKYANRARKPVNGQNTRAGAKRDHSPFPGLHASCDYCGRLYHWGGNGIKDALMCSGSKNALCWNSLAIPGAFTVERIVREITTAVYQLDGFDEQFRSIVEGVASGAGLDFDRRFEDLRRREVQAARERSNFLEAIRQHGSRPMFDQVIKDLDVMDVSLAQERTTLEGRARAKPQLPSTVAELRALLQQTLVTLAGRSVEATYLLRKLVPDLRIHVVRPVDGGHPVPRAMATIALAGVVPALQDVPEIAQQLTRTVTLDLFTPPGRIRIRDDAVRMTAEGMEQREIAAKIGGIHQYMVYRALRLDQLMKARGHSDPYVLLTEPTADYTKLCRSRDRNYVFTPLEGHERKAS